MNKALGSVFLLTATTLVALVACGGSDGSVAGETTLAPDASDDASLDAPVTPPTDGSGPISSQGAGAAYCNGTIGAFATAFGKCCSAADQQTQQYKGSTGLLTFGLNWCTPRLESGLTKGRLAWDAASAQSCYAAYKQAVDALACGPISPAAIPPTTALAVEAACAKVFSGLVVEGGACLGDQECKSGLTCVGWNQGGDGTCKRPPAIGETCGEAANEAGVIDTNLALGFGDHPNCATGAYCRTGFRKCYAQAQPGGACGSDRECPAPQHCRLGACSDAPVADVGGGCKSASDCKKPLYCDQPSFGAAGTCQPGKVAGDACGYAGAVYTPCQGRCELFEGGTAGVCKAYCGSQ